MAHVLTLGLLLALAPLAGCAPPAANDNQTKPISIGSRGTLRGGATLTALGVDVEAVTDWLKAAAAGDKHGAEELTASGRVFVVDSGAKVLVIDSHGGGAAYKVRILEGESEGRAGWVVPSWLKMNE